MLSFYLAMVDNEEEKDLVELLYTEYKQLMLKTALSFLHNYEDAEDAVHEAFLRVIKNLSRFSAYSCNENVSYLVITVRGISLNMLSARKNSAELDEETPDNTNIEAIAERKFCYEEAMKCIDKMSPALRNVATLYFSKHLTYEEIAELLDMEVSTVRSNISRARAILRASRKENANE